MKSREIHETRERSRAKTREIHEIHEIRAKTHEIHETPREIRDHVTHDDDREIRLPRDLPGRLQRPPRGRRLRRWPLTSFW